MDLDPIPPVMALEVSLWKKRTLSISLAMALIAGIAWATAPRARLSKPNDSILGVFDITLQAVASRVDSAMDVEIEKRHLAKANQADWRTVARRISLALIGNGLSLEEMRVLEQIPEGERICWWTEYVLHDRRSADYLAERWTRATVGTNQGPFLIFRRRKYVDWLADQLEKNTPYDVLVRELISSQGSWTDAPQVNFLTATMDNTDKKRPDAVRLAGRTSRAFLAQRIDCLQCHQDYLGKVGFTDGLENEANAIAETTSNPEDAGPQNPSDLRMGEQRDFHQLAAFFSGVRMENPFVGLRNSEPNYRVKYLNEEQETSVIPAVPYRRDLLQSSGNARERLAGWVTHPENKSFARSTVNRMWAVLFGKPLVEPVDSIPLAGPFPASLEVLSDDFTQNGYDLKRLIRTIICTEAFQRDSRMEEDETGRQVDIDEQHESHWAVFPLTQLRPEQMAASIHQASRIKAIDENSTIISQLELFGGVTDFTKDYGDRGEDEFSEQSVTIPQRLLVMNGKFVRERIKHNPIMNAATRISELASDDRVAVTTAYLSVLNRVPTHAELEAFREQLQGTRGKSRSQVMSSVFWTLFNSTEFQWNH